LLGWDGSIVRLVYEIEMRFADQESVCRCLHVARRTSQHPLLTDDRTGLALSTAPQTKTPPRGRGHVRYSVQLAAASEAEAGEGEAKEASEPGSGTDAKSLRWSITGPLGTRARHRPFAWPRLAVGFLQRVR
jgi:hypothetical protein